VYRPVDQWVRWWKEETKWTKPRLEEADSPPGWCSKHGGAGGGRGGGGTEDRRNRLRRANNNGDFNHGVEVRRLRRGEEEED